MIVRESYHRREPQKTSGSQLKEHWHNAQASHQQRFFSVIVPKPVLVSLDDTPPELTVQGIPPDARSEPDPAVRLRTANGFLREYAAYLEETAFSGSVDGFVVESASGARVRASTDRQVRFGGPSAYASQEHVWQQLGPTILGNAMQGFDATVLAYGQTGSGKTYTMLGGPNEPGIVPRAVHSRFAAAEAAPAGVRYEIEISMVEIYMEEVRRSAWPAAHSPSAS